MSWNVELTPAARRMLAAIADRRVRRKILERIDRLCEDPEQQGKPLLGELQGLRSLRAVGLRAVGQRYRVLYRLEQDRVVVLVVAVGLRKEGDRSDIYRLARKLLRLRLLDRE